MTRTEALRLVLELAEQNVLTEAQADSEELQDERKRQGKAIAKVRLMVINREKAAAAR